MLSFSNSALVHVVIVISIISIMITTGDSNHSTVSNQTLEADDFVNATQSPSVSLNATMQRIYESRFGTSTTDHEEEEEEEEQQGNVAHFQQLLQSLACYAGLPWCSPSNFADANNTNLWPAAPMTMSSQPLISTNKQHDVIGANTVDNMQIVTGDSSGFNLNDEMIDIGNDLINYGILKININVGMPVDTDDNDTDAEVQHMANLAPSP